MSTRPLRDLLAEARWVSGPDPRIAGITCDSRQVRSGYLFAALPGAKADGRDFIAAALAAGAVAVLGPPGLDLPPTIARIEADNPRRAFALMAARFQGAQPATMVAVTGTNGKTSAVDFTRQIWTQLGHQAASLGTLGLIAPTGRRAGALTTPDPASLSADLAALARAGVDHGAIEASSHGLDQCRLDGIVLKAGAFTNLTRDHLDYHGTMAAYFAAKARLFEALLPPGAAAVLNADRPEFEELARIARARQLRVIDYGEAALTIKLAAATPHPGGQHLDLRIEGRKVTVDLPLVAHFQAMNALAALGLVVGTGTPWDSAIAALSRLAGVRGRLELAARRKNGAAIYVDYAHTPDALETVLAALRPHAQRLIVLFGAGGDRDPGKRPQMGAAASRHADRVIVTDDNPRSEDPALIRRAVLAGAPGAIEIDGRRLAIMRAVAELGPHDVLVIAGKGHETGQTIQGVIHPFDDASVAREAAKAAEAA